MLLESSLVAKLGSSLVAYWKDRSIHEHQKKSEKQAEERSWEQKCGRPSVPRKPLDWTTRASNAMEEVLRGRLELEGWLWLS